MIVNLYLQGKRKLVTPQVLLQFRKESYRQMLVTAEPVRRRRLWADGQSIWR